MSPVYTQIAATAQVFQTQTAAAMPPVTATLPVTPTPEVAATETPSQDTPTNTPFVLATSQSNCDNTGEMYDVNYLDGYVAAPGDVMEKTWNIQNAGPCTWNKNYVLAYGYGGEGTNWSSSKPGVLEYVIEPGQRAEITIELTAPKEKGTYTAYFRMKNDKGFFFGDYVWISIEVQ
jgi:hypothetical protein